MKKFSIDKRKVWDAVHTWCSKAGRRAARPVVLLWLVMNSKSTPRKEKLAIFVSIAYLVLPINILNGKRIPVIGWIDEIISLAVAVQKMAKYITPEMEDKAEEILDRWFVQYTDYAIINEGVVPALVFPPEYAGNLTQG